MQKPPYAWMMWAMMLAYFAVFAEAVRMCFHPGGLSLPLSQDGAPLTGTWYLTWIYGIEALLAVGPGWCAMPGWSRTDVLIHHVPYMMAIFLADYFRCSERWSAPMAISIFTAANEGMFVAHALGAPEWLSKARRLFGFSIVLALLCTETWAYLNVLSFHWTRGSRPIEALPEQLVLPAIWYHSSLLLMYIKRWTKKRCL